MYVRIRELEATQGQRKGRENNSLVVDRKEELRYCTRWTATLKYKVKEGSRAQKKNRTR